MKLVAAVVLAASANGVLSSRIRANNSGSNCAAADLKVRAELQNKLAGACEDMCKEVGAHPKCNCPDFVAPDSTPGVMTWDELLGHMDNLVAWGQTSIKGWKKMSAQIQRGAHVKLGAFKEAGGDQGCEALDLQHRVQVQNKLRSHCEDMCKEVGAKSCNCPDMAAVDATPGVMTWDELNGYMDNLVSWSGGKVKDWKSTASQLQTKQHVNASAASMEKACAAEDLSERALLQSRLAKACTDMCKEVGAYPNCNCPDFVEPDSTPGVMTWDELLEYMDNLESWSGDTIKGWKKMATALLQELARGKKHGGSRGASSGCSLRSSARSRARLQNKLAKECEAMCKEVGAYPKCTCPKFVEPDSTPGEMTWDELNEYMDNLVSWGGDSIKGWKNTASQLQLSAGPRGA